MIREGGDRLERSDSLGLARGHRPTTQREESRRLLTEALTTHQKRYRK